ncbi:MAG TPA: hypothetical protein VNV37_04170, partial [Solirubrobacteraceae bacterium]|nr:hypothetical protein [Solirubrobacteraceae bacterium]
MDALAPSSSSAMERALALLEPDRSPAQPDLANGYLDLLDDAKAIQSRVSRRTMGSRLMPPIYERFERPLVARIAMGRHNPGAAGEHRRALEMLALSAGDRVLDLACGPGNFTRDFAAAIGGEGL